MNKILITGAGGFIGSHLTEKLIQEGNDVKALIKYNSKNNWGWLENSIYKNEIEIVTGDIRDYDSICNVIKGCKSVFHLAALIGIPYSYLSPKAYIETNIIGTYNILQAAKEADLEQIILTSTSETYGSAQYIPINETHPMVGQSPYSATKIAADQLAISYYSSFNLPVKIVRPFNTYGPRQSARAIIPSVISQILNGEKKILLGNVQPVRDLTYVTDTVEGFIEIFKTSELFGEVTNIGMNEEISIGNLASKIAKLIGIKVQFISSEDRIRGDRTEVNKLRCDNSKILSYTNWKPKYNLESGLNSTIAWMKNHNDIYKSNIYNV